MIGEHTVMVYADPTAATWTQLASNPTFDTTKTGWRQAPFMSDWTWVTGGFLRANTPTGLQGLRRHTDSPIPRPPTADLFRVRTTLTIPAPTRVYYGLRAGLTAIDAWGFPAPAPGNMTEQIHASAPALPAGTYSFEAVFNSADFPASLVFLSPHVHTDATGTPVMLDSLDLSWRSGTAVDLTCWIDEVAIAHGRADTTGQPNASTCTVDLTAGPDNPMPTMVDVGAIVTVSTALPAGPASPNLQGDSSFEAGVSGWYSPAGLSWDGATSQADYGTHSLKKGPAAGASNNYVYNGFSFPAVTAGHTYVCSAWVLLAAPSARTFDAQIRGQDSGSAVVGQTNQLTAVTPGVWTRIRTPAFLMPAGAVTVMFLIDMRGGVAGDTYWVDNVQIEESAAPTPYRPREVPGAVESVRFTGRISDMSLGWDEAGTATPDSGVAQLVAVGGMADLGRRIVGDAAWPAETDGARVGRVLTLAGVPTDPFASDPGTVQIRARDVDSQSALEVIHGVAQSASGMLWSTRTGDIRYADADHRRGISTSLVLDVCDILVTPTWTRNLDGLTNDVSIGYGAGDEGGGAQPRYVKTDPGSITKWGRYAFTTGTELAALADATAMGDLLIARNAQPVWILSALPVAVADLDLTRTAQLLALDVHGLITLTGLPVFGSAPTSLPGWVEGWTERLGFGTHEIELAVSGYCRTAPPVRWNDPIGDTWNTITPTTRTWNEATCWGPIPYVGRWDDNPASYRWDQVPDTQTWDNFPE